jgi:uncharacterized protein
LAMVSPLLHKAQIILVVIFVPLVLLYWYLNADSGSIQRHFLPVTPIMHIGDVPLRVEVASTDGARIKGLSGREEIGDVDGVLFVFPESGYHQIWMKDMLFPIDIIWIDENLEVINIEKNISPESYPRTYRPVRPAKYAVETNVHLSDTYSLRGGLKVKMPADILEY